MHSVGAKAKLSHPNAMAVNSDLVPVWRRRRWWRRVWKVRNGCGRVHAPRKGPTCRALPIETCRVRIDQWLTPVIKEIYSDAVSPAMREFGKIGEGALKVAHLALFPIQYGAYLQDRLARYLTSALEKVPEERRTAPRDAIMPPVAEKLRHQDEDGNPIAALYVSLLARAMDRERVGDAHPAFVHLIGKLAPDEVLILGQLSERRYRVFYRMATGQPALMREQVPRLLQRVQLSDIVNRELLGAAVLPEALAQPELFLTFLEHLVALGIAEYTNQIKSEDAKWVTTSFLGFEHYHVRLLHRACVEQGSDEAPR